MCLEEIIKRETSEQRVSLWGASECFTPVICNSVSGDGKQLIYFMTLDVRPYYWLVRIDSKTDIEGDDFPHDEILGIISNDFGKVCEDEEEEKNDLLCAKDYYPMITDNFCGTAWERVIL